MPKPDLTAIPSFYHNYVQLVQEDNIVTALENNMAQTLAFFRGIPDEKWSHRYAEGKWSIREMVQHILDAERIFSYRALCIARGEIASLPGFDENNYAAASEADRRSKEELVEEFEAVRKATILLFRSFTEEQLSRTGIANNKPIGVNSIGFITAGHLMHHLNILQERYLNKNQ
jgi:uncharacterized damage-inducible protein DinB